MYQKLEPEKCSSVSLDQLDIAGISWDLSQRVGLLDAVVAICEWWRSLNNA